MKVPIFLHQLRNASGIVSPSHGTGNIGFSQNENLLSLDFHEIVVIGLSIQHLLLET